MNRFFNHLGLVAALLGLALGSAGCRMPAVNTVAQFSTIDAVLAGAYDGQVRCNRLTDYGDFGIGTFDKLDGEMVLLDGKLHQVRSDGKVYTPGPDATTPFASVVRFAATRKITLAPGTDFSRLQSLVDEAVGNTNLLYAIKVTGRFQAIKTRSVPAQKKPYPPLVTVTENQPTFRMEDIAGTLVGFRLPAFVKGINVPGYHVHFLSDDGQSGGHLLEFRLAEGVVEIATCQRLFLILPQSGGEFDRLDFSKDRSRELEKTEK